jgi:DNA ligase (NAD+)
MYHPSETLRLQEATLQLLAKPSIPPQQIALLKDVIRFHEYRYYILNDPLLADPEFDALFRALQELEKKDPTTITPDSPTQRVAKGLTASFPSVAHIVPMLSLENSYNAEDLRDFDRKARELTGLASIDYCVEPKFDGAGISLIYEQDRFVRGATRGDGVEGEDITTNLKQIRSIPLHARFSAYGIRQIEIRGEVMMTKESFRKYNDQLVSQNLPPLANPRNAAAGALRLKDPNEVAKRSLEAFLYHVSDVIPIDDQQTHASLHTHAGTLDLLWELGLRSPYKEKKRCSTIDEVIAYCEEYEQKRDDLPYEIDGMVVKVNDTALHDTLGMTTHHPRWAIAFKFKARQATSRLRNVEFQVGRTGSITPVAKIEPVAIGGVTVTSVSLHNEDFIRERDIRIGDQVLVERAGDVIPYIVKALTDVRTGSEQPIQFPHNCPACQDELVRPQDEAVWRCINLNCPAQVVERIIHFTSKDAMDIRGLGEANIRKFVELGFLHDIPGIYQLPYEQIRKLEGFGERSLQNLQDAIEKSKKQPLHRLMNALGIRYVGETTAKALANNVEHLLEYASKEKEELQTVDDVGIKVAESLYQFFHNPDNIQMLQQLETLGVNLHNIRQQATAAGGLNGLTFLFTGTLTLLKRSEAEALVEKQGGKILGGVSSKLNYLVVGEDAGSKLEKAKKIATIRILSEKEFIDLIQKQPL